MQSLPVNKVAVTVVILVGVAVVEWVINYALDEPPPAPLFARNPAAVAGSGPPAGDRSAPNSEPSRATDGTQARGARPGEPAIVDTARKLALAGAALAAASGAAPSSAPSPAADDATAPAGSSGVANGASGRDGPPRASLDKESIRDAVRSVVPAVKHCYESGLRLKEDSQGVVKVSFTLVAADGGGFMRDAEIADSDLQNPLIDACVLEALSTARFPMPQGEGEVRVTYPFRFAQ